MLDKVKELIGDVKAFKATSKEEVEVFRIKYLGSKGLLKGLFAEFKNVDAAMRKDFGAALNNLKKSAEGKVAELNDTLDNSTEHKSFYGDLSRPSEPIELGSRHPISLVKNRIIEVFNRIGFTVSEGPEIEDDWHNFTALNLPEYHPARDMQDTFFIDKNPDTLLRTHTSSVQVRLMEEGNLPIRSIMPGRVYRNEAISARSNCFFHQVEGLYIDKGVSFSDLKQTLYNFVQEFFGANTKVRFRASYFPFTEPSAEMDIYLGTKTESDYKLTKGTGWLEILGCGMVDPNVLENCKLDTTLYSGFAFGLGVDRIAMLKYGVKDLRTFFQNDTRFLNQFNSI